MAGYTTASFFQVNRAPLQLPQNDLPALSDLGVRRRSSVQPLRPPRENYIGPYFSAKLSHRSDRHGTGIRI